MSSFKNQLRTIAVIVPSIALMVVAIIAITHNKPHRTTDRPPHSAADNQARRSILTASGQPIRPLGTKLADYIDQNAAGSSIYVESLASAKNAKTAGEHISIAPDDNGDKEYNAKSLMKLPLVMNVYKAAAAGKLNLDQEVAIKDTEIDSDYGRLWRQGAGYRLTLREASRLALEESDNTAIKVVNDYAFPALPPNERVYNVLGVPYHLTESRDVYIAPKNYAMMLRCLYFACYNTADDSQAIISMLENSIFTSPSRRLPQDVPVAHKIGTVADNGGGHNDCGIVFAKKQPFIFCIMLTKPEPAANGMVSDIVKEAYDYFET